MSFKILNDINLKKDDTGYTILFIIVNLNHEMDPFQIERILIDWHY